MFQPLTIFGEGVDWSDGDVSNCQGLPAGLNTEHMRLLYLRRPYDATTLRGVVVAHVFVFTPGSQQG